MYQYLNQIEILKGICFRLYSFKMNWKIDLLNEYLMKEIINDFKNWI